MNDLKKEKISNFINFQKWIVCKMSFIRNLCWTVVVISVFVRLFICIILLGGFFSICIGLIAYIWLHSLHQFHVFRINGDTTAMYGQQFSIFKQLHQIHFGRLLQNVECLLLNQKFRIEFAYDIAHNSLKWQPWNQQIWNQQIDRFIGRWPSLWVWIFAPILYTHKKEKNRTKEKHAQFNILYEFWIFLFHCILLTTFSVHNAQNKFSTITFEFEPLSDVEVTPLLEVDVDELDGVKNRTLFPLITIPLSGTVPDGGDDDNEPFVDRRLDRRELDDLGS